MADIDYNKKRIESNRPSFKKMLEKEHGTVCVGCLDESKPVQWHHVLALHLGGTNDIRNFVPLCKECHFKVHHEKEMREHKVRENSTGRKRIIDGVSNWREILDDYVWCRISASEAKEMLGLKQGNHFKDNPWFREYLDEAGIEDFRNNICIRLKNGGLWEGCVVGYVVQNGVKQNIICTKEYADSHPCCDWRNVEHKHSRGLGVKSLEAC